jgi:hypothetical protein
MEKYFENKKEALDYADQLRKKRIPFSLEAERSSKVVASSGKRRKNEDSGVMYTVISE